jgi:hypothetical protein
VHDPDPPKDQQPSPPAKPGEEDIEEKAHRGRVEILRWIREHPAETGAICAVLAVAISVLSLMLQGVSILGVGLKEATSEGIGVSSDSPRLTVIGKVKQGGVQTWGDYAEIPSGGGKIVYGLRIENTGQKTVDNLVVRADLPEYVSVVPGSCRYGMEQVAAIPCPGTPVAEGAQFPELEAGGWMHLILVAKVSTEVPGGRYPTTLTVTSDQTDEIRRQVEVKIPATPAEEAVRGLYRATEGDANDFWDGAPTMAPRSKRLLIGQWPDLSLERGHGFDDVPSGPLVSLSRLYYDHRLEGRVVELHASIIGPPGEFSMGPGLVKQSLEIGVLRGPARAQCYTVRSSEQLLHYGDRLEIKAIPIAWGIVERAGRAEETTMVVCPAVHRLAAD